MCLEEFPFLSTRNTNWVSWKEVIYHVSSVHGRWNYNDIYGWVKLLLSCHTYMYNLVSGKEDKLLRTSIGHGCI